MILFPYIIHTYYKAKMIQEFSRNINNAQVFAIQNYTAPFISNRLFFSYIQNNTHAKPGMGIWYVIYNEYKPNINCIFNRST